MQTREARLTSFLEGDLGDAIKALNLVITSDFLIGNERKKIVEVKETLELIKRSFI